MNDHQFNTHLNVLSPTSVSWIPVPLLEAINEFINVVRNSQCSESVDEINQLKITALHTLVTGPLNAGYVDMDAILCDQSTKILHILNEIYICLNGNLPMERTLTDTKIIKSFHRAGDILGTLTEVELDEESKNIQLHVRPTTL